MSTVLLLLRLASWAEAPATLPVCEPPPKRTITVPCDPHEGCEEKWIFVDREIPIT